MRIRDSGIYVGAKGSCVKKKAFEFLLESLLYFMPARIIGVAFCRTGRCFERIIVRAVGLFCFLFSSLIIL